MNKSKFRQNNIKWNWSGPSIHFSHPFVSTACKNNKYKTWRIDWSVSLVIPLINLWKLLNMQWSSVRTVPSDNFNVSHLRFSSSELTVIFIKIWIILISCLLTSGIQLPQKLSGMTKADLSHWWLYWNMFKALWLLCGQFSLALAWILKEGGEWNQPLRICWCLELSKSISKVCQAPISRCSRRVSDVTTLRNNGKTCKCKSAITLSFANDLPFHQRWTWNTAASNVLLK
jgi:hypothetical protein